MCGLFGIISTKSGVNTWHNNYNDVMYDGMYVTALRGMDSTGIFAVHEGTGKVMFQKSPVDPATHMSSPNYKKFVGMAYQSSRYLVGHARYATKGDVCWENAHPFVKDHIIMVHNGVARNTYDMKDVSYDVDSQYVAHYLAEDKNVEKTLARFTGAFALVWYNAETQSLHIVRNTERSLYYWENNANRLFFCSEPEMLLLALRRNKMQAELNDIKEFEKDMLYTYHDNGKEVDVTITKVAFKDPSYSAGRSGGTTNAHPFQGSAGWPAYGNVGGTEESYFAAAWRLSSNSLPIYTGDRIRFRDPIWLPYSENPERGTVHADADIILYGKKKTFSVEIPSVHRRFNDFVNDWERKLNKEDYMFSSKTTGNFSANDIETAGRVLKLNPLYITGWRKKRNDIQYYKFTNNDGNHKKTVTEILPQKHNNILTLPAKDVTESVPEKEPINLLRGPNGMVTPEVYKKFTESGCQSCGGNLEEKDAPNIVWHGMSPVCSDCTLDIHYGMGNYHGD